MKKIIVLVTIFIMVSLVGCGETAKDDSKETSKDGKKTLVVWTFTDEIKGIIEDYYKKDNPDLTYNIDVVVVPNENYQTKLDPVLGSGKNAPDVFAMEAAFVKKYIDSDFTMDLNETDLKDKTGDILPYVLEVAKDKEGKLKGLSWQGTPGAFFYRRSIAKEYLGVSEPEEIQALMNNFEDFLKVARNLKEKSNGKVKIISSIGDLTQVFYAAREHAFVENDTFVIDDKIYELFEIAKSLKQEELIADAEQWSEAWFASMSGDDVFGYFLPTWGLHYVLKEHAKNATDGSTTSGDWGVVQGPSPYFWGGTWVGIRQGSQMVDEAKDLIEYITLNEEFLTKWAKDKGDFLANKTVVANIKDDYSEEFLAGQNHYAAFAEMAKDVDASILQGSDKDIEDLLAEQLEAYSNNEKDLDTALNDFKMAVQNIFPDISIQ